MVFAAATVIINMSAEAELTPKSVQETAISSKEPSEKYFYKGTDGGLLDASVPVVEIPVVDFGLITSSSSSTNTQELAKLRSALSSWGCVQVLFYSSSVTYVYIYNFFSILHT